MRSIVFLAIIGLVLSLASVGSSVAAFQSPVPTAKALASSTVPVGRVAQLQPLATFLGDIARSAAAVVTIIVALVGLNKWRVELRGRTKLELARRMVRLAYTLRDQFEHARSMFTWAGESAERDRDASESPKEALIRDEQYARGARIQLMGDKLLELRELSWEAEVVFGQDIHGLVTPIEEAYRKLVIAAQTLFSMQLHDVRTPIRHQPPRSRDDLIEESHRIVYGRPGDDLESAIDAAVTTLVDKLRDEIWP